MTGSTSEEVKAAGERQLLVPELYARWALDCLVVLAHAVSWDFAQRPLPYRDVPRDMARLLSNFRIRIGADADWPNMEQRKWSYEALFGPAPYAPMAGAEMHAFREAAADVRRAAAAYSERVHDTGEPMLRQAFLDAVSVLQAYLQTLPGSVIDRAWDELGGIFHAAQQILQTDEVAAAFGLPSAPAGEWPLDAVYDGRGSALIQEISKRMPSELAMPVSQKKFLVLQRVAANGEKTLRGIMQLDDPTDRTAVDELIGYAYAWETAMRGLGMANTPS